MKPQDFERLSAYIDHQLSPAEKAALEQRLGREPELRAALSELRLTVKAVRSLPVVKPPRSFTLTAAQVGAPAGGRPRRSTSLFGTLRLAATLSALALVLVVGGDFAASRGYFGPAAMPAQDMVFTTTEDSANGAAQEAAATAAPEVEFGVMSPEAETATLIPEAAPGGGDGAPAAEATEATEEVASLMAVETPTPERTSDRMADETQIAEMAPDADETSTRDQFDTSEGTPSTKVVPPEATAFTYATEAVEPAPAPGFPPLRLLEAALAMLTVLLGLGTWFASRNA